jgi:hypothetical protein
MSPHTLTNTIVALIGQIDCQVALIKESVGTFPGINGTSDGGGSVEGVQSELQRVVRLSLKEIRWGVNNGSIRLHVWHRRYPYCEHVWVSNVRPRSTSRSKK